MIPLSDVLADKFFYSFTAITQPSGKTTSAMLWNPADSGVAVGIRQIILWSNPKTEFNIKWRTTTHGTDRGVRNSIKLIGTGQAQSQAHAYTDLVGVTGAMPSSYGFTFQATDGDVRNLTFVAPPVLMPETGLLIYPDSYVAMNWTATIFFEEQALT